MFDAAIICLFILAGAGIGFHIVAFLPTSWTANVDVSGLRWVTLGFGFVFGAALGALVRSGYRRLERTTSARCRVTRSLPARLGW